MSGSGDAAHHQAPLAGTLPLVWGIATALVSALPVPGSALIWGQVVLVLVAPGRYGAAMVVA